VKPDPQDCCFDEWARGYGRKARRTGTAAKVTTAMLASLEGAGLAGRTVLDVGCGAGDLALGTLERGAARADGVDLGPGAIAEARSLAAERGLADRAAFTVGDGATVDLPRADVVVLHRVLCCYRSADALLANAVPAARQVFAFTAPVDHGPAGAYNQAVSRLGNGWYRLRDRKFRGFRVAIHDLDACERAIEASGFRRLVRRRSRWVWDLRVYERSEAAFASA
jgi:magnesium-protoporphyrin O-methyltransferase